MTEDPFDLIRDLDPKPSTEVRKEAWTSARDAFLCEKVSSGKIAKKWRWVAGATAVAAAVVFSAMMWSHDTDKNEAPVSAVVVAEVDTLYRQGYELFGSRLIAVSVSKEKVTWHLNESSIPTPEMDQFVTLNTVDANGNQISMAVVAGVPVRIPCEEKEVEMEFLPDGSDEVIAYGDGIYWESRAPDFPVHTVKLQMRCKF